MPIAKPAYPLLIRKSHPVAQGLVFCMPLYEGYDLDPNKARLNVKDIVNNLLGTFTSQASYTFWKGSKFGLSCNFSGAGIGGNADQIKFEPNGTCPYVLKITGSVSIFIAFKVTAFTNANARIAGRLVSGNGSPFIAYGFYSPGSDIAMAIGTTTISTAVSGTLNIGQWYTALGTYDGANIKLYIDGKLVATTAKTGTLNDTGAFCIGADQESNVANETFNGQIACCYVWNKSLTEHEAQFLAFDPFCFLKKGTDFVWLGKAAAGISVSLFDSLTLTESNTQDLKTVRLTANVFETLTIAENRNVITGLNALVNDAISILEDIKAVLDLGAIRTENISIVENLIQELKIIRITLNTFETITIAENIQTFMSKILLSLTETVSIVENLKVTLNLGTRSLESITITEFVKAILHLKIKLQEIITISEFVKVTNPLILTRLSDSVSIVEYLKLVLPLILTKPFESITISESISVSYLSIRSKAFLENYIRRYLDDPIAASDYTTLTLPIISPVNNSVGGAWEVAKSSLTSYIRRYMDDL